MVVASIDLEKQTQSESQNKDKNTGHYRDEGRHYHPTKEEAWTTTDQDFSEDASTRYGEDHENGDSSPSSQDLRADNRSSNKPGRVLGRIVSRSTADPGPPPDGGWVAWSQCFIAHLVMFNTWGWANSFGTFQTYYVQLLDCPPSQISWIGSINVFLIFFVGSFSGRLTDAGYFHLIFLTGSFLLTVGIFMTSLCTQYWQFLLAQGLCIGLGHGLLFCPAIAVVSSYFQRNRALAVGIAGSGSVTGGLVFPSMVRQLLPAIGFPWTVRAIGFLQVAILILVNLTFRTRVKPRRSGPLVDLSAFKDMEYSFYAAASFFNFWGAYFATFYVAAYSRDALQPPLSYPDSLNLLLVLNGVGFIGRTVPNYVADRFGIINVFIPTSIVSSILMFCFIPVKSPGALYAWTVLYGIAAAGIMSLLPAGLSVLTTDVGKLGTRIGMVFTIVSFSLLTGPPIAGAIIQGPGGYTGAKCFAGASIFVGGMFLLAIKMTRMRMTGQGWKEKI
ncbi:MFS-type transporter [Cladobotryum mycophilum]|uniref:MFS-type transporter n=1 Tax=Cladobotryum mycophilum TaxID=491253 RepID=A0ABR0SM38_9HYPO